MESDRFLQGFNASDREIAEEFLIMWLPFLTKDICNGCCDILRDRIRSINTGHDSHRGKAQAGEDEIELNGLIQNGEDENMDGTSCFEKCVRGSPERFDQIELIDWYADQEELHKESMSWADMAQEAELEEGSKKGLGDVMVGDKMNLSREQRERIRFNCVGRKMDFISLEKIGGRIVNVLEGLELHTGVFSAAEQRRIVDFIYDLQDKGKNNEFGEHTYSEPRKWMRGKGRVTIQFGCCYNYAEKNGNPPGILRDVYSDPIPNLLKVMIKRLIRWHVLPTDCVPDSCIVNIYEPGDCIPPHIDNHDFVRPFCTVSFLSECNILFGSNLKIAGPGDFIGSVSIPLPVGSVLVLKGNGADVAKHCVPSVPYKRISITFRKMDKAKWPYKFKLEPDLQTINPFDLSEQIESQQDDNEMEASTETRTMRNPHGRRANREKNSSLRSGEYDEFMERSARRGATSDDGSSHFGGVVSSSRRVSMHRRYRDNDSFIRRRSNWDSRHPRERIRLPHNYQRVR